MAKLIGAHLSVSSGIDKIQKQMNAIGAKCCAVFLKNQRRYDSKPLCESVCSDFKKNVMYPEHVVPHGSYLINLGNPEKVDKSYDCLVDDLKRCNDLGISLYNLHPGSDVLKLGVGCLDLVINYLNKALREVPSVTILLENMAGQGNVLCSKFEDIKYIIDKIEDKSRIGVCLDTCHMFAAGYDIRTADKFESILQQFDKLIGLQYIKAVHLNDSKADLGSKKDRHEHIGKGKIGIQAFQFLMSSCYFDDVPMILETPHEENYAEEISLLYSMIK